MKHYIDDSPAIGTVEYCEVDEEGVSVRFRLSDGVAARFMRNGKLPDIGKTITLNDLVKIEPEKKDTYDYDRVAEHMYKKYRALRRAGFGDEQAIDLLPMWDDNVEET